MPRHKIVAAVVTEGDGAIVPEIDKMAKCVSSEAIIDDFFFFTFAWMENATDI